LSEMPFPLPVSKNTHINGVILRRGLFAQYSIVWSGEFLRADEEVPTEKHVFILQHMEDKDFLFSYWKSSENEPRILTPRYYEQCFQKEKSVSASNRYLFQLNDKFLLLPYVPVDLFQEWTNSLLYRKESLGHSYLAGLFQEHVGQDFGSIERKRITRFCGWYASYEDLPIDAYRKLFVEVAKEKKGHNIDISQTPENLSKEQLEKVKESFRIVKSIFKSMILQ
jgi:hypothetical protein